MVLHSNLFHTEIGKKARMRRNNQIIGRNSAVLKLVFIDKLAEVGVQGNIRTLGSLQSAVRPLSNASNCDSTTLHWPPPHLAWPHWYFALPTALRGHYSGVNEKIQNSHRQKMDTKSWQSHTSSTLCSSILRMWKCSFLYCAKYGHESSVLGPVPEWVCIAVFNNWDTNVHCLHNVQSEIGTLVLKVNHQWAMQH